MKKIIGDRSRELRKAARSRRLGDITEGVLRKIGVTPRRWIHVKSLFGLAPACGCKERKEWLNRVSDWWMGEKDA